MLVGNRKQQAWCSGIVLRVGRRARRRRWNIFEDIPFHCTTTTLEQAAVSVISMHSAQFSCSCSTVVVLNLQLFAALLASIHLLPIIITVHVHVHHSFLLYDYNTTSSFLDWNARLPEYFYFSNFSNCHMQHNHATLCFTHTTTPPSSLYWALARCTCLLHCSFFTRTCTTRSLTVHTCTLAFTLRLQRISVRSSGWFHFSCLHLTWS